MVLPDLACLRIAVYEDSGRLLGHRVLPVTGLCPGYRHVGLRNDGGQPLNLATLFVNIMVKGKSSFSHSIEFDDFYEFDDFFYKSDLFCVIKVFFEAEKPDNF